MKKREAKQMVKRALGLMLSNEGLSFKGVWEKAVGEDLPEDLEPHEELLDDCLFEVCDELQHTGYR